MRITENECKTPSAQKRLSPRSCFIAEWKSRKKPLKATQLPRSAGVCVTFRASWYAGTFPFWREIFLQLPVGGGPALPGQLRFPFLCLWAPALSLPACAAVLTARRSLSTSHLVADSLFQPASYSFKSLFESRNGSHFGFSKTNMDKTTQCPLSMMDTGDP